MPRIKQIVKLLSIAILASATQAESSEPVSRSLQLDLGDENKNCDPGTDVERDQVKITDVAFSVLEMVNNQEGETIKAALRYFPEQVIPFEMKSSVFFYLTGEDGQKFSTFNVENRAKCGFEFNFEKLDIDATGHASAFTFPKRCFDEKTPSEGAQATLVSDVEYFYCIGTKNNCDRVTAGALGFLPQDRNSLRDEAYCTKLTYKLKIDIVPDGLDDRIKFVLEYVRDPIIPVEQFITFNGIPVTLEDDVLWAICDENDRGVYDYATCFERLALNPEPRVLSLSTEEVPNTFALTFALGELDRGLVSDSNPLNIVVEKSEMWLFHALYTGNYGNCDDASSCTKVTPQVNFDVGVFGNDANVLQNYWVRMSGDMPLFVEGTGINDMRCDESFCSMVWVLNFRSNGTGRRLEVKKQMKFKIGGESDSSSSAGRLLEEKPSTQRKLVKVKAQKRVIEISPNGVVTVEEPAIEIWLIVVIAILGLASCGVFVYFIRKKNQNTSPNVNDMVVPPKQASHV